jgi:hypothetical protein
LLRIVRAACLLVPLLFTGCAKLLPASLNDLGSAEKVVVITFRDGETLQGRIIENQTVTFQTFGKVYKGEVEEVGDQQIVLKNAYVESEYDRYKVQRERMESGQLKIQDESTRIVLPTYRIVKVERKTIDKAKTARYTGFWIFTGTVLAGILNDRL